MYNVVYAKSLEYADDIETRVWEYETLDLAINLFNEQVNKLVAEILENEFLQAKISIHRHKALVRIEGTHYCISIVDDRNRGV